MNLPAIIANQIYLPIPSQTIIFSIVALIVGIVLGVIIAHLIAPYFPFLLSPREGIMPGPPDTRDAEKYKETHEPSAKRYEEVIKDTIDRALLPYILEIEKSLKSFEALISLANTQQETAPELHSNLNQVINQISGMSQVLGEMPVKVRDEMVSYKRQEEARKLIEEQRIKEEKLQKSAALLNRRKQELREGFLNRLEVLETQGDLIEISTLLKQIADELQPAASNSSQLEKVSPYLRVASQVEKLKQKLESFEVSSFFDLDATEKEVEGEFGVLEISIKSLSDYHSARWFFDLLAEAAQYPTLRSKMEDLKRLLNLEEVEIIPGTEPEPQDMDKIEVEVTEGYGSRTIISEVLENGYRLKESGTILKKPRVKVRLEG
jgi:hypothetical protein